MVESSNGWRRQWHPTPVLTGKIPWMEDHGGLQSMGLLRVRHDWATSLSLFTHALEKEMATLSNTLAWKIPWTEEPVRLQSMGLQRVGHDWATSLSYCFTLLWSFLLYNKVIQLYVHIYPLPLDHTIMVMWVMKIFLKLSTEELMFLNCGVWEDSWESLGLQGDPTSPS